MKLTNNVKKEEIAVRSSEELALLLDKLYAYGDIAGGYQSLTKLEQVKLINSLAIRESFKMGISSGYQKLEQSVKEIENRILNRQANKVERKIYSAYLSRCLFKDIPINKKALNACAMQIISEKDELCEDNVFVLFQYALAYICQTEDRDITFSISRTGSLSMSTEFGNINRVFINVNYEKYLDYSIGKKFSEEMLIYLIFALLHEVQHIRDYQEIRGNNDLDNSRFFKEVMVVEYKPKFYERNHDSFTIEKSANQYAYDFIFYFLKGIVDEERIIEIMNKYGIPEMLASKDVSVKVDKFYSKLLNNHFDDIQNEKNIYENLSSSRK